ncbi:hypothetical protein N752_01860 [Desulforamulus aquiferis]|nr:hypothetical protein N752_01860 [Desulforamulus aquiferis]
MIKITLKDGSVREYPDGTTIIEVAKSISHGLAKEVLAGKVNGKIVDVKFPLQEDAALELLTFNDEEGRAVYRHSSAHIMAQAVQKLFPEAKLAIGPAIQDGFYYDFDVPRPFTPAELEQIEAEMQRIIKADLPFERVEVSRAEALEQFNKEGELYKVELINDLPEDSVISCYQQGEFNDLCAGPMCLPPDVLKALN